MQNMEINLFGVLMHRNKCNSKNQKNKVVPEYNKN